MPSSGVVPIIDFAPFLSPTASLADKEATAHELLKAMKDVGFVMLKGFYTDKAVSKAQVDTAFTQTKSFFGLPIEAKDKLAWPSPEANRGYVRQGRERVTQATSKEDIEALRASAPDLKETMEIGKDTRTTESDSPWPNQWPEQLPEFKTFMVEFFASCHNLHLEVLRALALALGLGESFFDDKVAQQSHNLRLLNYPSVLKEAVEKGGNRAGAHSDYGTVTLLFQDNVGGLEVQDKEGNFVPAVPVPDTVVVNVGDLLQRWSNDVLKSTIHRVVLPHTEVGEMTPRRNSIAFFSNPSLKQIIECLPGLGEPKYPPVECEAYLVKRLSETFA